MWQKRAFDKLAALGALVMLPTKDGKYLLQREGKNRHLRPPGGHWGKRDDNLTRTVIREINEEFGLEPEEIQEDLTFLGYETREEYKGNGIFLLKNHGLKPGTYQASNSKTETIILEEASLDDPDYTGPDLDQLAGEADDGVPSNKQATALSTLGSPVPAPPPVTGPEAIRSALAGLDLDKMEQEAREIVSKKLKSKRPDAIKTLGHIDGLRRMGYQPQDLMLTKVPVIPAQFRPYSMVGDAFVAGDANELYRDLFNMVKVHKELEAKLGPGAAANRLNVYDTVAGLYGFSDPLSPKSAERGVSGFLKKITNVSPKFSFFQRKLLAKDQDYVARGVIGVDPDLDMDEIGVPEDVLWKLYQPYLQRNLVRRGMPAETALRAIRDRTETASRAMDDLLKNHPVIYSRAPAWHKFNVIAGTPKRIKGDMIRINPLVTTGLGGDFDGDSGRFYLRIKNVLATGKGAGEDGGNRLKQNSPLRVDDRVIHISNFPHRDETAVQISPGVTEYDVPEDVRVYALNRETWRHAWLPVTKFSVHENLEMWQVNLTSRRAVFVSSDHSLVVYKDGKLELSPPSQAKRLAVPRIRNFDRRYPKVEHVIARGDRYRQPTEFKLQLNYDTGTWLGMLIGDGCVTMTGQVYLYGAGDKVLNRREFEEITRSGNLPYGGHTGESKFTTPSLGGGSSERERSVINDFKWFSFWVKDQIGDGALHKRIPDFSLNASDDHLRGLLNGLMSTDGAISVSHAKKKPQLMVAYYTSSPDLVTGFQLMCKRLGIRTGVTSYKSPTSGRDAFLITVSTVDLAKRHKESPIEFTHPEKNRIFQEQIGLVSLSGTGTTGDAVPYPAHLHQDFQQAFARRNNFVKNSQGKTNFGMFASFKSQGLWQRYVAQRELDLLKSEGIWGEAFEEYQTLVNDLSIDWEQVTDAVCLKDRMTGYDITVPGAFTFALDDGTIVQDTCNIHVPSLPEAIEDAREKLMPSRMLFSVKDRNKVVPAPKQEFILGAYQAQHRPARAVHNFPDQESALKAIRSGQVALSDEINLPEFPAPAPVNP
jgi:hypothetical protein